MSQKSFDFLPNPTGHDQDIQKWVEEHNRCVIMSSTSVSFPPGSLLAALDRKETKVNAVYLLRGILGQHLRKAMVPGALPLKKAFIHALRREMAVKKTSLDPALGVQEALLMTCRSL